MSTVHPPDLEQDLEQDRRTAAWVDALAEFDRATRTGEPFAPPAVDGPDGLGPMPAELREHAERLLTACLERIDSVQAEMDGLDGELDSLRRSAPRGSWTDDAQGSVPGAGHLA